MQHRGALRFRLAPKSDLPPHGHYVQPAVVELGSARELREEVFGPVLHVVRWRASALDELLDDLAANGTALTLGINRASMHLQKASRRGCRMGTSTSIAT